MIQLVLNLDAPEGAVTGVKEHLAAYLERWGDLKLIEVREIVPEQMRMDTRPERGTDCHTSLRAGSQ